VKKRYEVWLQEEWEAVQRTNLGEKETLKYVGDQLDVGPVFVDAESPEEAVQFFAGRVGQALLQEWIFEENDGMNDGDGVDRRVIVVCPKGEILESKIEWAAEVEIDIYWSSIDKPILYDMPEDIAENHEPPFRDTQSIPMFEGIAPGR